MTTDNVVPMLGKHQPLDVNLQALRDHPSTAHKAFGNEWAANCAGSALAEIARLQAQLAAQQALVVELADALRGLQVGYRLRGWEGDHAYLQADAALAKVGR